MMYWNGHMTTAGWIVAILWTVIIFVLIAGAVYWLARSLGAGETSSAGGRGQETARQILDRRLAAGEIGVEEHARLRAAIEDRPGPAEAAPPSRPAPAGG